MRTILRLILVLVVVAIVVIAAAMFFAGYRFGDTRAGSQDHPVSGTSGSLRQDTEKARETAQELGAKVVRETGRAREMLSDGALTAKIKSKMALDDHVKALDIHVDTANRVVTLSGVVHSEAERRRALALAKDTLGVKSVIDRLEVQAR